MVKFICIHLLVSEEIWLKEGGRKRKVQRRENRRIDWRYHQNLPLKIGLPSLPILQVATCDSSLSK